MLANKLTRPFLWARVYKCSRFDIAKAWFWVGVIFFTVLQWLWLITRMPTQPLLNRGEWRRLSQMQLKKKVTVAASADWPPASVCQPARSQHPALHPTICDSSETTLWPGSISGNSRGGPVVCSECQSRRRRQQRRIRPRGRGRRQRQKRSPQKEKQKTKRCLQKVYCIACAALNVGD